MNTVNMMANIACFSVIILYAVLEKYDLIITCIPVNILFSVPYILNYYQKFKISKFLFMLTINLSILFGSIMIGYHSGMSLFLITGLAITYIVYSSKEIRALVFFTLISLLLLTFIEINKDIYFSGLVSFTPRQVEHLRLFMLCFNVAALSIACYSMHAIIDKLQLLLLKEEEGRIEQTKLSALGVMSAGIAHEINNPLAIICSRVEQIIYYIQHAEQEPQKLIPLLENVKSNSERIAKIVASLRNLARSSFKDSYDPFPIGQIINDSLELCRQNLQRHNIRLHYTEDPRPLKINCRPSEMMQVLINLINNAVDAIAHQSDKWISIEVESDLAHLKVKIIDSGHGIPKDIQAKIMQPFFTTKDVGKGTGLGLSISNTIMENHGGKLYMDASAQHTCFVVSCPLAYD